MPAFDEARVCREEERVLRNASPMQALRSQVPRGYLPRTFAPRSSIFVKWSANTAIRQIAGLPGPNRAFSIMGGTVGFAAGAAAGAIAGPIGVLLGSIIGALAGMVAWWTIEESDRRRERQTERLDREIGVIDGDLGAPPSALAMLGRGELRASSFEEWASFSSSLGADS